MAIEPLELAIRAATARRTQPDKAVIQLDAVRRLAAKYGCSIREVECRALEAGIAPLRYERNLGTIGIAGQLALLRGGVVIVGAGGLGGYIAEGLARMGVGGITIIDDDTYNESNLNRQLGCTEHTLGQPKAQVIAERVRQVNSAVEVSALAERLTAANARELLHGTLVAVDALDNLPDRLLLQQAAAALGIPLVHGAIAGNTGQVMTIYPGDRALQVLYGDRQSLEHGLEQQLGNPAATPMMIAAWQVAQVVAILTGTLSAARQLLFFDMEYGESTTIELNNEESDA